MYFPYKTVRVLYILVFDVSGKYNDKIIQGVSRLLDITAGGDFLRICDQKKVHINMCPILEGYGVMGIF
jgi:hypothetical protein